MLGILVYWGSWYVGGPGILGILVYWGSWYIGDPGILGILVYWGSWYVGDPSILGILVCWGSWYIGEAGILGSLYLRDPGMNTYTAHDSIYHKHLNNLNENTSMSHRCVIYIVYTVYSPHFLLRFHINLETRVHICQ